MNTLNGETFEQEGFRIGEYLTVLRRRKWLILGLFTAGILGGVFWNASTTPIYEAVTTMHIGPPPFASFLSGEQQQPSFLGWILTTQPFDSEIQVIRSRTLAEEMVKRLHAGRPPEGGRFLEEAEDFRGRLSAGMIKGTTIMAVKVRNSVAETAAREANALSDAYIAYTAKRRVVQLSSAEEFIGRQLGTVGHKLRTMQESLKAYQTKHRTPTVASETVLKKVIEADVNKAKLDAARKEAEAFLEYVRQPRSGLSQGLIFLSSAVPNAFLSELAKKLNDLEFQRSALRRTYTERHPDVVAFDTQIRELKGRLIQETEATVRALRDRERLVAGTIGQFEAELKRRPEDLDVIDILRTSKVTEELYGFFLKKQEEARIAVASQVGDAQVIDRALPPGRPILPNTSRNHLMGALLGLGLGLGLAFVRDRLDRSVRSVEDLEKRVGLPVFGTIPAIGGAQAKGMRRGAHSRSLYPLLVRIEQGSPALEAYRSLRTNIQFAVPEVQPKSFLFTSPGPGEGKSLTAANLAIALAEMGGRILLVDADLRKPVLHGLFRAPRDAGLTDLLVGEFDWRYRVRPTEVPNLDLLPGGPIPPNPSAILGSNRMKAFLNEVGQHYDAILIDSPPVLPFTDASVLGSMVDGVFLVARAGVTTPEALFRARTLLQAVNARVLGAVLNAVRPEDSIGKYGYYRYRYYYHYYGSPARGVGRHNGWLVRLKQGIQRWDPRG
jgi:tyrosine-protein kinase Etk/Wzc